MADFLVWLRMDRPQRIPRRRLLFIDQPRCTLWAEEEGRRTTFGRCTTALWYPIDITVLADMLVDGEASEGRLAPPLPPPSPPTGNDDQAHGGYGGRGYGGPARRAGGYGGDSVSTAGSSMTAAPPERESVQIGLVQISLRGLAEEDHIGFGAGADKEFLSLPNDVEDQAKQLLNTTALYGCAAPPSQSSLQAASMAPRRTITGKEVMASRRAAFLAAHDRAHGLQWAMLLFAVKLEEPFTMEEVENVIKGDATNGVWTPVEIMDLWDSCDIHHQGAKFYRVPALALASALLCCSGRVHWGPAPTPPPSPRYPHTPSSSSQRADALGTGVQPAEIIEISDDDGEEEDVGETGGPVKKEPVDDIDWPSLLLSSEEEKEAPRSDESTSSGGPDGTSNGIETSRREGASDDGEEEREEEVGMPDPEDKDGAEDGHEEEDKEEEEEDKEEDEWEQEEEEESEESEEDSEEPEAEEEPGRRVLSDARLAGWYITKMADTGSPGGTVASRLRSKRRCPDAKLLRQATRRKPYCVDTPSQSSSDAEEDEKDKPPPHPARSSSDEGGRGHGRTGIRRPRRRGQNADDDSDEDGRTATRGGRGQNAVHWDDEDFEEPGGMAAARRREKQRMEEDDDAADGGDEADEQGASWRAKKEGAASCRQAAGRKCKDFPAEGWEQQGDVTFKKSSLVPPRRQDGRDQETYDDLLYSIFEGIETTLQNASLPLDAPVPAPEQGGDPFPLVFSFGVVDEVVPEKTALDDLWAQRDLALDLEAESNKVSSHTCHKAKESTDREPAAEHDRLDMFVDDILKSVGYEGASNVGLASDKTGVVWDLIPGVREDMFPHQREGFEFMWRKLAGGIDIEQLRHTMNTDTTSGCVISHAPGTGKTRLAITFVQSYLELFPHCRPVIIAPRGMLATWEQEFSKWNVKLPFHVLSSSEIQWNQDKTIHKLVSKDHGLGQKLAMKKLSQKSKMMLKLASWYEGSSIIGLSYSLYRNLAKGEGKDGEMQRNLLLEKPGLLVLDEGHTPRNKKSLIWKVLAEDHLESVAIFLQHHLI
uniref:SNF2 N-terminal domain-containing protein n=1 Tax=Aegilops tauschii TaxID=37682 RepID=R7WB67_AEGTA